MFNKLTGLCFDKTYRLKGAGYLRYYRKPYFVTSFGTQHFFKESCLIIVMVTTKLS